MPFIKFLQSLHYMHYMDRYGCNLPLAWCAEAYSCKAIIGADLSLLLMVLCFVCLFTHSGIRRLKEDAFPTVFDASSKTKGKGGTGTLQKQKDIPVR